MLLPILSPLLLAHSFPSPASPLPPEPATLVIETLSGELRRSDLSASTLTEELASGGVFFWFEGLPAPTRPDPSALDFVRVELPSGERVRGLLLGGGEDALEVELADGARIGIDVEELHRVELPARLASDDGGVALEAPEGGDRLYRRRGAGIDRVDGLVHALESEGVRFESALGERVFPWSELAALFVEPLGDEGSGGEPETTSSATSSATAVVVDLHGGTRLAGDLLALDAHNLTLRRGFERDLVLPTPLILEMAAQTSGYRFLSEIEPHDLGPLGPFDLKKSSPASGDDLGSGDDAGDELGMVWPARFDRAQSGGPLRAGGREWARGIGVHAPSRLTWKLHGEYSELRLGAAVDDEVRGREGGATVVFVVEVDGEERYRSPLTVAGDEPIRVPTIDLSGAEELVLAVETGGDSFALDRADWLRPILVQRP